MLDLNPSVAFVAWTWTNWPPCVSICQCWKYYVFLEDESVGNCFGPVNVILRGIVDFTTGSYIEDGTSKWAHLVRSLFVAGRYVSSGWVFYGLSIFPRVGRLGLSNVSDFTPFKYEGCVRL